VIVDFTNVPMGTEVVLQNLGPDEPFGGGVPDDDFDTADPNTTGLVMQFRVVPAQSVDVSTPPELLLLPQEQYCQLRLSLGNCLSTRRSRRPSWWMVIRAMAIGSSSRRT
jgi:hypothetical protein